MISDRSASAMSNRTTGSQRFNPITGEERIVAATANTRSNTRPAHVPPLPIGNYKQADDKKNNYSRKKQLTPPSPSSSFVSWGYEDDVLSVRSAAENGGRTPAPFGVPTLHSKSGGTHYKNQYEIEDDAASVVSSRSSASAYSYRSSRSSQTIASDLSDSSASTFRDLNISNRPVASEDAMNNNSGKIEQFERLWASKVDHNASDILRRVNKEEDVEARRREAIVDAVMADQLSRAPMCDPGQDTQRATAIKHVPGLPRGTIRHLHHSEIRTANSATEQLLSDRVRFTARLLSASSSRDVVRELTGFFFSLDSTFTIYEFKNFGKNSKALPFVKRGHYRCSWGRRRGQPYTIFDIYTGNTLYLSSEDQSSLPKTMRSAPILRVRISEVDDKQRKQLMIKYNLLRGWELRNDETVYLNSMSLTAAQYARIHLPSDAQELDLILALEKVQEKSRSSVRKRGIATLTGLLAHCRRLDEEGLDQLPRHELELALNKFRIHGLTEDDLEMVWDFCDPEMSSFCDYSDYILAVFGETSEPLKRLIFKAFLKIDTQKKGTVSFSEIGRFYRATSHPSVKQGEMSTQSLLESFLDNFRDFVYQKDTISAVEFIFYYEGLAIQINDQKMLAQIIQNCWNV